LQRTGESIFEFQNRLDHQISQYWNGPIVWRKKKGKEKFQSLKEQIKNAYAVIGERTMACVQSCLLGTPAFTVDNSMTTLLMGGVENLKTIEYPDRHDWWEHICWSQFTVNEFSSTLPAELTEQYQIA
jgi:exopolysaccharide biosynthesis predicted pyruvyltransferase EpsI